MTQPTLSDWLLVGFLAAIWGASFMAVSLALAGYGPLIIVAGRITLGAVALLVVARAVGHGLPSVRGAVGRRIWLHVLGMAAFSNALPFFLLSWGQQHVTSGFAGITMAVVPLFTLIFAHVFLEGERLNGRKMLGFMLGIGGVAVLIGPAAFGSTGAAVENWARFACIVASSSYAAGSIITRLCPPVPLVSLSAAALSAAAVMILPLALIIEGAPALTGGTPLFALIYLGLGPTALATLILVQVIRRAGPTFLIQTNYQVPVWSVIFGTVFLHEALPPQFLAALGLILAGLAVSRARAWRRRP